MGPKVCFAISFARTLDISLVRVYKLQSRRWDGQHLSRQAQAAGTTNLVVLSIR